jgi:hypothetical protein
MTLTAAFLLGVFWAAMHPRPGVPDVPRHRPPRPPMTAGDKLSLLFIILVFGGLFVGQPLYWAIDWRALFG